jgi:hypothetical protein
VKHGCNAEQLEDHISIFCLHSPAPGTKKLAGPPPDMAEMQWKMGISNL